MDPRRLNGGPFLGLNGIVIKSHGGTDAFGFASAIEVGYNMAESDVLARLAADLEALHGKLGEAEPAARRRHEPVPVLSCRIACFAAGARA